MRLTQYPAIPPAVGLACGVLLYSSGTVGVSIVAALAGFGAVWLAPRTLRGGSAVCAASIFLGFALAFLAAPAPMPRPVLDGQYHFFRGEVVREQAYDGRQRLILATDSGPALRLALSLSDVPVLYAQGDIVRVNARADVSGKTSVIPFNSDYNRPDRVSGVLYARPDDVELLQEAAGMGRVRNDWLHAIYHSGLSTDAAELLASAWMGTHDVAPAVREQFRASGLSHLLCVSGFHLGLLSAVVMAMTVWFNLFPRLRLLRYVLSIAVAWGFAFLVGFQPPVIRAAVMLTVYLLARVCERGSQPLNSLAVAVIVIMIINPYWIYSVGFQLSVAAVAGIIVLARRLNPVPMRKRVMTLHRFAALFALPLAAMIATAPVVLWHFRTVPLLSIPVNALAALIFPCFMTLGALCVVLSAAGLCPNFLISIVNGLSDAVIAVCDSAAAIPFHSLQVLHFGPLSLGALVLAIVALVAALYSRGIRRMVAAAAIPLCLIASACAGMPRGNQMVVYNNMYSTVVAFKTDSAGIVISPSGFVPLAVERYFAGNGVEAKIINTDFTMPQLARRGNVILAGHRMFYLADKGMDSVPGLPPDLVILTHDSKINSDTLTVPFVSSDQIAVIDF